MNVVIKLKWGHYPLDIHHGGLKPSLPIIELPSQESLVQYFGYPN